MKHEEDVSAPDKGAIQVDADGGPDALALAQVILPKGQRADVEVDLGGLIRHPLEQSFPRRR